jgi:hypothetical protein
VLHDPEIVANSLEIGKQLRSEDGIANTIDFIDRAYGSFPYPWAIRVPKFQRNEVEWTDENFANFFDDSIVIDNA